MTAGRCFACGRPSQATPSGFHAALACAACRDKARLLPGGTPLNEILKAGPRGELPLDGLSMLLNPVAVGAYRGWAGFAASEFEVFGEAERCQDWFDFVIRHIDPGPDVLTWVTETRPRLDAAVDALRSLAQIQPERIKMWILAWTGTRVAQRVLSARPPLASHQDAWDAAQEAAAESKQLTAEEAREMLKRLYRLADVEPDEEAASD